MKKNMVLVALLGMASVCSVWAEEAQVPKVEDLEKDVASLSEYIAKRKSFMEGQIAQEQEAVKSIEQELKAAKKFALIAQVKNFEVELHERTRSLFAGESTKHFAGLKSENAQDVKFMKKIQKLAVEEYQETLKNAQGMIAAHKVKFPAYK